MELWIAREILSNPGVRTDLVTDVTKLKTWTKYCNEILSPKPKDRPRLPNGTFVPVDKNWRDFF